MGFGNGLSGLTAASPYNIVVDSGVFYSNINLTMLRAGGSTAWANAISPTNTWVDANGKTVTPTSLGVTRGGGTVKLNRDERQVEFDSRRTAIKGFTRINMIDPEMSISLLEVGTPDVVTLVCGASTTVNHIGWREITPQLLVQNSDYIGNIALAATITGEAQPMVIVLENARVVAVGDMSFTDKSETVFQCTFRGHSLASDPLSIPLHYFVPIQFGADGNYSYSV